MKTNAHGRPRSWDSGIVETPELLTAKELESLLRIDLKTIYAYAQRGLIPHVKIQRNIRFVKRDIVEWIEAHTFRPRVGKRKNNEIA